MAKRKKKRISALDKARAETARLNQACAAKEESLTGILREIEATHAFLDGLDTPGGPGGLTATSKSLPYRIAALLRTTWADNKLDCQAALTEAFRTIRCRARHEEE